MPYIGTQVALGNYRKLTNLASSFNGVTTAFTLSVPPGNPADYVIPTSPYQLVISVGGVIQQPDTDYTISTSTITFTTAPPAGLSFFGLVLGDALNTGTPSDATVSAAKLNPTGALTGQTFSLNASSQFELAFAAGASYYCLNANLAGANVSTAQNIFNVGVTLAASTVYEFEGVFAFSKAAGTTSHTVGLGFGGTATLNNIGYLISKTNGATSATDLSAAASIIYANAATSTPVTSAITSAAQYLQVRVKGTVSTNGAGTFIPQYTLSAAPGGAYSSVQGSFFKIAPIGVAGGNSSQGTWS